MKYTIAAAAALFTAAAAPAAELVTNGNFSAGNTGFTTTYGPLGAPATQGGIAVTTNPASNCSCFVSIGDHTTGTGNMLLVDGAAGNTGAFWSQTFSVVANSAYSLSFWASNVGTAGQRPIVRATINGADVLNSGVLPYSTGNTASTWNGYATAFNSGAATTVTLSFFSDAQVFQYNDFAVDDISFTGPAVTPPTSGVPEPATWAMMMLGFGAMGGMLRRRSRVAARVRYA